MSYSPPLGSAVNFQATGLPYTPPAGGSVNFDAQVALVVAGALSVGGAANLASLGTWELYATGSCMALGGKVSLYTEIGRRLSIASKILIGGEARVVTAAGLSAGGQLRLHGSATINPGSAFRADGKIKLRGSPRFKAGTGLNAGFRLQFTGAARFMRGARTMVASSVKLGVLAQSTHAPEIILQVSSGIVLRGRARVRYRG